MFGSIHPLSPKKKIVFYISAFSIHHPLLTHTRFHISLSSSSSSSSSPPSLHRCPSLLTHLHPPSCIFPGTYAPFHYHLHSIPLHNHRYPHLSLSPLGYITPTHSHPRLDDRFILIHPRPTSNGGYKHTHRLLFLNLEQSSSLSAATTTNQQHDCSSTQALFCSRLYFSSFLTLILILLSFCFLCDSVGVPSLSLFFYLHLVPPLSISSLVHPSCLPIPLISLGFARATTSHGCHHPKALQNQAAHKSQTRPTRAEAAGNNAPAVPDPL